MSIIASRGPYFSAMLCRCFGPRSILRHLPVWLQHYPNIQSDHETIEIILRLKIKVIIIIILISIK